MAKICYVTTLSVSIKSFFVPQLKRLAEEGFDVTVICSNDDALKEVLGENITYIPVDMPRGVSFFRSLKAISQLKKIFKREKFDLIQYSTPNAAFYASLASKWAKTKVRNYHLMGLRYLGESGIKRKILYALEKIACKNSTHIECVSPSNLTLAVNEGLFKPEKGTVVWNGSSGGVDLNRFNIEKRDEWRREKREQLGIDENQFVYGFVGRITRDKGINELTSAFYSLSKDRDCKLVVIGAIDQDHNLDEEVIDKITKGEKVVWVNQVYDVEKYYPVFDALVFPSYREGFGNVVIEAEAMGVPVIVSNIPGPVDAMVNEETGILVEKKNVEQLTSAMIEALTFNERGFSIRAEQFVRENFDSIKLCQKVVERKKELLDI